MKTVILLEMAVLAGGAIITRRVVRGHDWQTVLLHDSTRVLIAVLILTVLLLSLAEVGLGGAAGLFGGLVVLGYLLSAIGWLGPALPKLEAELFG
jgi:hypothetical protein